VVDNWSIVKKIALLNPLAFLHPTDIINQ